MKTIAGCSLGGGQETPANTVSASLSFVGFGMRPDELTRILGIQPSSTDVSFLAHCKTGRKEECGLWSYETTTKVPSRDVGEHIAHLLHLFRPLKSRLDELTPRPNVFFHVNCEAIHSKQLLGRSSLPLFAPRIAAGHVLGIADLGAALQVVLIGPAGG